MKISDRDKKLIVIILIVAVIALPFLFIIKPTQEKEASLDAEIATLTERYEYLDGLNQQREFYLSEIDRLTDDRNDIIAGYAEGIRQENVIMFLRGLELKIPVKMNALSFSNNTVTPILAETTDAEGNVTGAVDAIHNQTSVAYVCKYESMKTFLEYILEYEERMVVSSVSMNYDSSTGNISGSFVINQYAFTGDGRELAPAIIPSMEHGNESIFGTYISDEELAEKLAEQEEDDDSEDDEESEE